MVESVSIQDKQKSVFSDISKKQNVDYYPVQASPMPVDKVVIENRKKNTSPPMNKFQIASLALGALASSAVMIYFAKSSGFFGKNKQLLKDIKKADLPDNVSKKLEIEYDKFKKSFIDIDGTQNYIKNVLRLNWSKPEKKLIDIDKAKKILDEDHIGLDKVKEEIISFLRVQNYNLKHNVDNGGPLIVCLDGPPGVGKTSIAESIAKAMDKPFERISLAGVSHKSFISGADRLYKGAEPGQIIKSVQNAGVSDPVILIDEIDKMGSSMENGDPAFALLDVLEPKQCKRFTDAYIDIPYDLSNVTFVITSNDLSRIPAVLKDRLSIIHIPPYLKQEKIDICKFNIQKILTESKITSSQVEFSEDGIEEIVKQTNDKGARRTIENIRGVFTNIKQKMEIDGSDKKIVINKDFVTESLKNRKEEPLTEVVNNPFGQNSSIENLVDEFIKFLNREK